MDREKLRQKRLAKKLKRQEILRRRLRGGTSTHTPIISKQPKPKKKFTIPKERAKNISRTTNDTGPVLREKRIELPGIFSRLVKMARRLIAKK